MISTKNTFRQQTPALQPIRAAQGFSLPELMVAMVLGLFMSAAVAIGYLSTKRTYNTTQQVSRIQENSRFAVHFLASNLRDAGNLGCVDNVRNHVNDNLFDISKPILAWNYVGTNAGETYPMPANNVPSSGSVDDWQQTNGAINGATSSLPTILEGKVMPGTDVFFTQAFAARDDLVIMSTSQTNNTIVVDSVHGIPPDTIIVVSDCVDATDRYQTNPNENAHSLARANQHDDPGNVQISGFPTWSKEYGPESNIYQDMSRFYYIGQGASGLPALFYLAYGTELSNATGVELVEGVENMQLTFGEDTSDPADRIIDNYVSADEVADWGQVISVRVGLLMRSINDNTNDIPRQDTFVLADNITITPNNDRVLRYPVQTTVKLRNSGLSQKTTGCSAAEYASCPN